MENIYLKHIKLTFLLRTPHRVKSVTNKLYVNSDTSDKSGRIWQTGSITGSTDRSSANNGCPLKPSGFFSLADITSLTPNSAFPTLNESVEKEHCISDTVNEKTKLSFSQYFWVLRCRSNSREWSQGKSRSTRDKLRPFQQSNFHLNFYL